MKVKQRGDTLFAPGITDANRALAVVVALVKTMSSQNIRTESDIWFTGSVGEEGLGDLKGMKHLFREGGQPIASFIAIDGGGLEDIVNGGIGSLRYRVTFKGPGGHSYGAFGIGNPHNALAQAVASFVPKADEFTKEGLGIRSTARLLKISTTTLLKRIITIAKGIHQPIISKGKTYEVDEMCTYIRHKRNFSWIVLAFERETKRVVTFSVGKRTNKTLSRVLDILKLSVAKKIFTDRLKNYRYLIEEKVHSIKRFATNHVERLNLTLRTHLKRLNRRTICFSRSWAVLTAILRIYFWG